MIYNDDELYIICVVNYNTHARIVSIWLYYYTRLEGTFRVTKIPRPSRVIILCIVDTYRDRGSNIPYIRQARSL